MHMGQTKSTSLPIDDALQRNNHTTYVWSRLNRAYTGVMRGCSQITKCIHNIHDKRPLLIVLQRSFIIVFLSNSLFLLWNFRCHRRSKHFFWSWSISYQLFIFERHVPTCGGTTVQLVGQWSHRWSYNSGLVHIGRWGDFLRMLPIDDVAFDEEYTGSDGND